MRKLLYGFDPHALQNLQCCAAPAATLPTKRELLRIGIPPRKVERVRQELCRLAAQDRALATAPLQLKLAKEIAKRLL